MFYVMRVLSSTLLKGMNVFVLGFSGCHVYCNFILGYIRRITVNFGTLKDELISIFASSNCCSDRNIFQNGVDTLSKIDDAFLTKS